MGCTASKPKEQQAAPAAAEQPKETTAAEAKPVEEAPKQEEVKPAETTEAEAKPAEPTPEPAAAAAAPMAGGEPAEGETKDVVSDAEDDSAAAAPAPDAAAEAPKESIAEEIKEEEKKIEAEVAAAEAPAAPEATAAAPAAAEPHHHHVNKHKKSGYLEKFSVGDTLITNWKKRWFVLREGGMTYHANETGKSLGTIPFGADTRLIVKPTQAHHKKASDSEHQLAIVFTDTTEKTPSRYTLLLRCTSAADKASWEEALRSHIQTVA